MHEEALKQTLCWRCVNKDYDTKWNLVGQSYKSYTCDYVHHHNIFGTVRDQRQCRDFESEPDAIERTA